MSDHPFVSQFSPQRTDPEALEQILVQRHDLLAESVALIQESILTANKHHLLFIGSRGAGKTHLVTLIHHRLHQQSELADKLRFAWLNEDETATSFLKLLILIYRDLTVRYPQEFPASDLHGVYGLDADIARERLGEVLLRHLEKRTLVVLMENLDSLFKHMPEPEQRTWRAFVQNHPVFATVGTAQTLFAGVSNRDEPFFGFFDTRHLDPLNVEDALRLLKNIAQLNRRDDLLDFLNTHKGHARVQAIHDLAGGNPRLYIIFSDFLTPESLDDLVRPFEETVDRQLTSYYQERLRWLSAQQREIVQLLCHHRQPVPVKAIAEGLFTSHNTITGQLKLLREMRYVSFHQKGREVLYELAEPLMRLSLQVKETHDRKPLALIVDFLRVWYDRKDLEDRLDKHDPASPGRAYIAAAIAGYDSGEPNLRHQLLRQGLDDLDVEHCDDAALARLRSLAEETNDAGEWLKLGRVLKARKDWEGAVQALTKAIELPHAPIYIVANALNIRGITHGAAARPEAEIADYTRIIGLPDAPAKAVAIALNNRGITHGKAERHDLAIADLSRTIELSGAPAEQVAEALNNRGVAHEKAGRTEAAIADFTRAIELPGASAEQVANAFYTRGIVHGEAKRPDAEIADYTSAIELPDAPHEEVAKALNNRGITRGKAGSFELAIADFTRAIELPCTPSDIVVNVLNNRGIAYSQAGSPELAIADYTRVIELPTAPAEQVAEALNNRGITHGEAGRTEAAIADFTRAIQLPGARTVDVVRALFNMIIANVREEKSEPILHNLLRLFIVHDKNPVSDLVAPRLPLITRIVVTALFDHSTDPQRWASRLAEFLPHFASHQALPQLGDSLVQHLPTLAASPLNHAAYDAWADCWTSACKALAPNDQAHMEIPLRLLRAGIAYYKTKDESSLLVLPSEERKILRDALKLPPENAS